MSSAEFEANEAVATSHEPAPPVGPSGTQAPLTRSRKIRRAPPQTDIPHLMYHPGAYPAHSQALHPEFNRPPRPNPSSYHPASASDPEDPPRSGHTNETTEHPPHILSEKHLTGEQIARRSVSMDNWHATDLICEADSPTSADRTALTSKSSDCFCEVCWQLTTEPVGCEGCCHRYCIECLSRYWTSEILSGRHARVQCMYGYCCAVVASDSDIRGVVSHRTYKKMKYFLARDRLASRDDVAWCAKDMCWAPIFPSQDELRRKDAVTCSTLVRCGVCNTAACFECGEPWHPNVKCPLVHNRTSAQTAASRAWTSIHTKPCPQCKVRIQKNSGCKHMNCTRCNANFCWRCGGNTGGVGRTCRCESVLTGVVYTTIAALVVVGSPVIVAGALVAGPPYCVYKAYRKNKERKNVRLANESLANFPEGVGSSRAIPKTSHRPRVGKSAVP